VHKIEYRLNDGFELIFPNVGDAELRSLSFNHPNIELRVFLPMRKADLLIRMENASFLSLWSSHPQNVIDRIFMFPNLEVTRLPEKSPTKDTLKETLITPNQVILTIEPVAGPYLICSGDRVTFLAETDL
jgi:hypothetical protein